MCAGFSGQLEGRRLGKLAIDRGTRHGRGGDACVQGLVENLKEGA